MENILQVNRKSAHCAQLGYMWVPRSLRVIEYKPRCHTQEEVWIGVYWCVCVCVCFLVSRLLNFPVCVYSRTLLLTHGIRNTCPFMQPYNACSSRNPNKYCRIDTETRIQIPDQRHIPVRFPVWGPVLTGNPMKTLEDTSKCFFFLKN